MSKLSGKFNHILKLYIILLFAIFFVLLLITCYKAPVTGRSQLILISPEMAAQMGATAFQEMLRKEQVSNDPKYNEAVRRVGTRIAQVSDTSHQSWDYKVIKDDDTINAFALPGGKVGVYTGILPIAKTEAGLATVMGHEVAHVAARHGAERISAGILAELGAVGLGAALRNSDPTVLNAIMQAYGIGVTVGGILPFTRSQESEADRIGILYMARAGYDPRESVAFWQRMGEATKGKPSPPEFLATHPSYGTRINNLNRWVPEAMYHYERSNKAPNNLIALEKSDYREVKKLSSAAP